MWYGFYQRFGTTIEPSSNAALHQLSRALLAQPHPAVSDIIPAYNSIYIEYDTRMASEETVREWLERVQQNPTNAPTHRTISLPVNYNGDDLAEISQRTGLSLAEIIQRHSAPEYRVYALGFTPGFPFMATVDPALQLPRRATPRKRVPANSLAMAQAQTGIYPISSPGGWHLLGRVLEPILDIHRAQPLLLEAGDRVRFQPSHGAAPSETEPFALLPEALERPAFYVHKAGLYDVMVDAGRFRVGRLGFARGGALDAPLARLANQLVGNRVTAAVLELNLLGPVLEALRPLVFALTGAALSPVINGSQQHPFSSYALQRGDQLSFQPNKAGGARSYLALAGAFAVNSLLGSASADPRAHIGRCLQAGDTLGKANVREARAGRFFRPRRPNESLQRLRILPGPQANPDALAALSEDSYRVRNADRMGIRLEGAPVAGGDIISEAVPIGAIQVSSSGLPMILLHDRGTLGGYAKPAIIHPYDLAKVAQLRVGDEVRFVRLA